MSELLKTVWLWAEGKKTIAATVGLFIVGGAQAVGWINQQTADILTKFLLGLVAVGVADRVKRFSGSDR